MTLNANLKFSRARQKLPKTSGKYLCITGALNWTVLDYSSKYHAFNVSDDMTKTRANRYAINVIWWTPLPCWAT